MTWLLAGRPSLYFDIWNEPALIAEMVDAGTIVYGWFITVTEGVARMALWAWKESQKKLDAVEARGEIRGRVRIIDEILADPALDQTPELRRHLERRKSEIQATAPR